MPRLTGAFTAFIYLFCSSANANNEGKISSLCDTAARVAAQEFDVPVDVLLAITRTETGRSGTNGLQPWPWTVNMEGAGYWFPTRKDALTFALDRFHYGATSFDVGCFQINFKWHGQHFNSIEDMFEPSQNARYAAHFLTQLYSEFESWSSAAGAFHSRTPSKADIYVARFDRIRLNVGSQPSNIIANSTSPLGIFDRRASLSMAITSLRPLVSGESPVLGSLFPSTQSNTDVKPVVNTLKRGG